ncbi:16S rRNA (guanine(527)-N(7))-methyltransferase RsmG [Acetobacteraceae bacterium]|nr:16S rRNA (guanine(527)-N(7))-methyltransferase RsmG [Acetobacteraceae bacterium]
MTVSSSNIQNHVPRETITALPAYALSHKTKQRLRQFEDITRQWNQKINLVSHRDVDFLWERHIQDSLRLLPLIPKEVAINDLGSGGGFPGIVIAIANGNKVTMLESDQRKCAFLREASRLCQAPTKIVPSRLEEVKAPPAPIVTARALAPLPRLLDWAFPFLETGGACLFFKGRNAPEEIEKASKDWDFDLETFQKKGDEGVILKITNLMRKQTA